MNIGGWLHDIGLGEYAASFADNRIDAELLHQLTDDDLRTLGVGALGDRKRLLTAIAALDGNPPAGGIAAPLAYTPEHLAERILNSRHALEGERKHVTMLFADIKGSTELIEELDPEDAAGRLNPALSTMIDAVHRFEGTVNRVQGDGIMALFGAPLAHEDHAVRACFAAIAIRDSLQGILEVRVGLHCGEVLVRAVRNDLSMDYDVVGSSAHLAARMEQSADPGTIRITAAARALAQGYIETRPLGAVPVKGMKQEIEVHELLSRTPLGSRWEARAAQAMTAFVGRRHELESLLSAAQRCSVGKGQLVALVGDAGMGKSRLLHEFTQLPQIAGWTRYQTGALPHGSNTHYLPLGTLLHAIFEVSDRDDQSQIDARMRSGLEQFVSRVEPLLPVMQVLLDLPVGDPVWATLNARQRASRVIDSVKSLLLQITEGGPLLLVFEDLHWIDPGSQQVLDALVEGIAGHPLLLVITYRPEYQHDWMGKSYYTHIRVDSLAADSVNEMLDSLLGADSRFSELKNLLIERTEGRPLFIEETVRSLKETGVLEAENGELKLIGDLASIDIPASVQDVLAARIDRLAPELKNLLQTAAVIGRRVPVRLLQSIVGVKGDALLAQLLALQSAEFMHEVAGDENASYLFKHALTEEVAYASLTRNTRAQLHGQLVDAIETTYSGRLDEHLEELARHALRAKRWDKAFTYNREAAKKAHGRSAYAAAIGCFDHALQALDELPDDDAHRIDKMDIRLEMRTALWPLGRHAELEARVREAGELAERAGDIARHANVHNYLTAHYWQAGDHARAIEHGEKGIELAERAADFSVRITTMQHLGLAFHARGEFGRQVEILRGVAAELSGPPARQRHGMAGYPAAITRGFLAWGLAELGEFVEALDWARQGVEIAGEVNSAMSTVWVTDYLALTHIMRGDHDPAIELLERNLELCDRAEVRLLATITCGIFGLACSAAGRQSEAIALLERAAHPDNLNHHPECSGYPLVWLAEAYSHDARWPDAAAAAARALETARSQGERGHEAWARFAQAEIERAKGVPAARVAPAYGLALEIAETCAMRPLAARCQLGLALAATADPDSQPNHAARQAAQELFQSMGMQHWLGKALELAAPAG